MPRSRSIIANKRLIINELFRKKLKISGIWTETVHIGPEKAEWKSAQPISAEWIIHPIIWTKNSLPEQRNRETGSPAQRFVCVCLSKHNKKAWYSHASYGFQFRQPCNSCLIIASYSRWWFSTAGRRYGLAATWEATSRFPIAATYLPGSWLWPSSTYGA